MLSLGLVLTLGHSLSSVTSFTHLLTSPTLTTISFDTRYEDAEGYVLEALEIREELNGPDHPHTAFVLNALASIYADQGERLAYFVLCVVM